METSAPEAGGVSRRAASSRFAFTTRRPVAILMVVMAVAVFGWVSYSRLPLTLMPDISYPTLSVRTEYPGTAPEEIETLISRPLEGELGIVPKLVKISSISQAGQSDIILEFEWDANMLSVAQDIREKVDRVRLPNGAERPLLLRYDPSLDPILRVGLSGPQTLFELRYLADNEIKRALESISGVAAVKVKGGLEEEFQVSLDERKLALLGLDISTVNSRLAQGNVNLPGGNLREGQTEYLIRTMNEFRTIEEIRELIITRENGVDVRLRDIGEVRVWNKERQVITRVNGQESIEIEIYKEAGANVVDIAQRVRDKLYGTTVQQKFVADIAANAAKSKPASGTAVSPAERMQEAERVRLMAGMTDFITYRLPPAASLALLSDQSVFIERSIDEVKSNAVFGGLIAIAVLYAFLRNVLQTLIIGVTIPVSIIATFAPMNLFGVSLNIISLGGLALGVGMLVDNAIVVLESIFRCREEGDDHLTAVVRGTGEVGGAVTASTLTTVAVFLPIVFVEGVAGQIFGDMALTIVFSLMASLFAALFFIPMLASRRFQPEPATGDEVPRTNDFLQLGLLPENPTWTQRMQSLGAMIVGLVTRVALVVGAAVWLVLRIVICVVVALLGIWRTPGSWSRRREAPTWIDRLATRWSDRSHGVFHRRVWPGVVAIPALEHFHDSFAAYWRRFTAGHGGVRIVMVVAFPVVLVCLLARLVFELALKLVGGVLLLAGLLAVLPVILVFRLGALVLEPLVRPLLAVANWMIEVLQKIYGVALDWSARNKVVVIGGSFAALAVVMLFGLPRLGRELIPQVHQNEFNLDVSMPVGTPLERTALVVGEIERLVLAQPEVERASTRVGTDEGATSAADEGEHTGRITLLLKSASSVSAEASLIERVRARVADMPEVKVEISYPALFTTKAPIEIEVHGYDLDTLRRLSREVELRMRAVPGLADVRSSLQAGNPELQVIYNRERLAAYGLTLSGVAGLVRNKVQGQVATDFRDRERNIDVFVRLKEEDRLGLQELRNLVVNPTGEVSIPLEAVADIQVAEGPSEIRRIDQQRTALVTANTDGIDLGTASLLISDAMRGIELPAGFHYEITGQNEEMQTSLNSMVLALALAVFLVYIVMASQFESLLHPFIIMFSVPLALVGVVLVLWIASIPLSIIVFIGVIMLAGIVVNNAIVLVDFINTLRASGLALQEAVRQAGAARLRPILMTTLTTVLGLIPMALGLGEGAEIRAPMAITVIVGLTSSTLLTLVVIPTLYLAIEEFRARGHTVALAATQT